MEDFKNFLVTLLIIVGALAALVTMASNHTMVSYSQSIHELNNSGTLTTSGDSLWYTSKNRYYSENELSRLEVLSEEYIIYLQE